MKKKILRFFGLLDEFNTSILKRSYWKYKFIKHKKGFDIRETWSLDFHLAKLISPRLKEFKKQATNCGSLPGNILEMFKKGYKLNQYGAIANKRDSKRQWEKAKKFWENKIQDMIDAFDMIISEAENDNHYKMLDEKAKEINKKLSKMKNLEERAAVLKQYKNKYSNPQKAEIVMSFEYEYYVIEKGLKAFQEYFRHLWW